MIDYFQSIDPTKKRKVLIVFDDMIADMKFNKNLKPIITEYLILQSYFTVPKNVRLNATYYFIMKIANRRELQQI